MTTGSSFLTPSTRITVWNHLPILQRKKLRSSEDPSKVIPLTRDIRPKVGPDTHLFTKRLWTTFQMPSTAPCTKQTWATVHTVLVGPWERIRVKQAEQ